MGMRIIVFVVLSVLFYLKAIAACTPHTVSMNTGGTGQNAIAFTNDGNLGGNNGITYFVHWDLNYLYLGWNGGTTIYSSDLYYAALDVNPGGSDGSIQGVSFSQPVMDYYVVYENNSAYYGAPATNGDALEVWQANGSNSWTFLRRKEGANDGMDARVTFGTGAGAEVRLRIPWSDFGGFPSSFKITMWVNVPAGNNSYSSYPPQNPTGNGFSMTHGVEFISTGAGVCPAASQNAAPLPVELTSFSSRPASSGVLLDWRTASERNNSHFDIQRSTDSRSWQTIGTAQGAGTTLEPQVYNFIDRQPLPGINYYRLKQVDFDGQFKYSHIISIDFKDSGRSASIAPNPVGVELTFTWSGGETEPLTATIFDVNGKVWQQTGLTANSLSVEMLPPGAYFIKIENNSGQVLLRDRFIKK